MSTTRRTVYPRTQATKSYSKRPSIPFISELTTYLKRTAAVVAIPHIAGNTERGAGRRAVDSSGGKSSLCVFWGPALIPLRLELGRCVCAQHGEGWVRVSVGCMRPGRRGFDGEHDAGGGALLWARNVC